MYKANYPTRILIGFDQLVNTIAGGYPDETISARAYRLGILQNKKKWRITMHVINSLFFFQKQHCKAAYESEQQRNHSPIK